MLPLERRNSILQILEDRQFISSSALCEMLNASESTIRRDLEDMESKGLVDRVHGGALLSRHVVQEPLYQQSLDSNFEEKVAIAEKVSTLIEPHDVIFLNHGTTNEIIARAIAKNVHSKDITIVTSNLNVIQIFMNTDIRLICLGGQFRSVSRSLVGSLTIDNLQQFHANKCFIGVDGINIRYGCSFSAESDASVSKQMIKQTHGEVFVVADHTKWGVVAPYFCTHLERIDTFITGRQLDPTISMHFQEKGLELVLV